MHPNNVLFTTSPLLLGGYQVLKFRGEIIYFGVIDSEVDVVFDEVVLSVEDFRELVLSFDGSPTQH